MTTQPTECQLEVTSTQWTLEIPEKLRSTNHFSERHWTERYREREHWESVLHIALVQAGHRHATPSPHRQRLTITRHLGPRERHYDDGNLAGGSVKQIVDAIKNLGWMHDDSPRWLETRIQNGDRRECPMFTVTLEELQHEAAQ